MIIGFMGLSGLYDRIRVEHIPEPYEAIPLHGDGGETGGHYPLQLCPYRRAIADAPGTSAHHVCDCAGGIPIGSEGEADPRMEEICGSCNIPSEIDSTRNHRSCLFLIPVRIWESGRLRTGFSCRWFYNLKPKRLPKEVWLCCLGCQHWFPRPPDEEMIPRMMDWIHKIIRLYWEPEPLGGIWRSPLPQKDPGKTPNSLLRERLYFRINRFREALRMRRDRRAPPMTRAEE